MALPPFFFGMMLRTSPATTKNKVPRKMMKRNGTFADALPLASGRIDDVFRMPQLAHCTLSGFTRRFDTSPVALLV